MDSYRLPGEENASERRIKSAKVASMEGAYARARLKDHDVSIIARKLSAAEQVTHVDGQACLSIKSMRLLPRVEPSYLRLNWQYQYQQAALETHVDGDEEDCPGAELEPCAFGQAEQQFLKNKDGWLQKKLIIRLACRSSAQTRR